MSVDGIKSNIVQDKRTAKYENSDLVYNILEGNSKITYGMTTLNSVSNSNLGWNIFTQDVRAGLIPDPQLYMIATVRVKYSKTVGLPAYFVDNSFGGYFGLRAVAPMQASCISTNVQINNAPSPLLPRNCLSALLNYNERDGEAAFHTTSYELDTYADYEDSLGKPNNCLGRYEDSTGPMCGRGSSYSYLSIGGEVVDGLNYYQDFEIRWSEPIINPPFNASNHDKRAIFGVKELTLTYNLSNSGKNIFSVSPRQGYSVTDLDVQFSPSCWCRTEWIYAESLGSYYTKPHKYPVLNYNPLNTGQGVTIAGGADAIITTQNVNISFIPKYLYFYVQKTDTRNFMDSDTFCEIKNINLTFAGIDQLQNLGSNELYKLCANNRLNRNYQQFSKYTGSVIKLDVQKNVMLDKDQAVGSTCNVSIQAILTVKNLSKYSGVFNVFIMTVEEGILTVENGTAQIINTHISPAQLRSAEIREGIRDDKANDYQGSGFGDTISTLAHKAAKGVSSVVKGVSSGVKSATNFLNDNPALKKTLSTLGEAGAKMAAKQIMELMGAGLSVDQAASHVLGGMNSKGLDVYGGMDTSGGRMIKGRNMKKLTSSLSRG